MKKVLLLLLVLSACAKESSVGPAKPATFVRYFNGGNSDVAQAILETAEKDLILLATTEVTLDATTTYFKIKLIKTDAYGNLVWQKLYPDFSTDGPVLGPKVSYKGKGITAVPGGGYVIVGDDIQNGSSQLLILSIDKDGTMLKQKSYKKRKGSAVGVNKAGNFVVLASIPGASNYNMSLAEFNKTTLDSIWGRNYGAGEVINLSNKLSIDDVDNVSWSGSVKKDNQPILSRIVKTPPNSQSTIYDQSISSTVAETNNDFVTLGGGTIATIGALDNAGTTDISFRKMIGATSLFQKTYPIKDQDGSAIGNSLCVAKDGGLVLLGTSKLAGSAGRGETDYCLVKIDGLGNAVWTKTYGSKFEDVGASIITTSDGGHVVLGTTNLANIKSILLMKTDQQGNIQ